MRIFGRSRQTVGLDIGSGLVKAAVVDHGGAVPELARVVVTPLADDAIVEGEVMDPALVADAVRETLAAAAPNAKHVVVAIGGRDVIVKRIRMERVKEAAARELIQWEAEQHVPFDMDSVQLDFQILDPQATGPEMSVLLVAAKRELVEAKVRLLEDAGAHARVVDVDAFALHNAFETAHPDALTGVVALANVGHEVTNVNILEEGVPVLTRDLACGTRRVREDLQRELGLSARDAERVLQGMGDGGGATAALGAIVARHAQDVAVGVERAAAFLESASRTAGPLRALYLCGGGARIPGLAQAVAAQLRVQVDVAQPLAGIAVRDGAFDGLDADAVAPLLMLPVGLALRKVA
ncbi:type IV pilus assembly protein PilM [Roseisolibacter sp. H3M3-2]|uniref:type IV pilus assembly protein PilM n=1 Tax=Roseisolibacter sp. H3M3-2 TaxID=3031323 RepID=UPI0023DA7148|nr:type IV pilus assembly protein PilM [Roseisolibacter sp. H3M3-2]MDF1505455.1 type IV pilus assembly protein PilM [Roseisolibacter sp. H3M3-2]